MCLCRHFVGIGGRYTPNPPRLKQYDAVQYCVWVCLTRVCRWSRLVLGNGFRLDTKIYSRQIISIFVSTFFLHLHPFQSHSDGEHFSLFETCLSLIGVVEIMKKALLVNLLTIIHDTGAFCWYCCQTYSWCFARCSFLGGGVVL